MISDHAPGAPSSSKLDSAQKMVDRAVRSSYVFGCSDGYVQAAKRYLPMGFAIGLVFGLAIGYQAGKGLPWL